MKTDPETLRRVYAMSVAGVYPHCMAKVEKEGAHKNPRSTRSSAG